MIDHGLVIADDTAAGLKSGLGDLVVLGFASVEDATLGARRAVGGLEAQAQVVHDRTVVRIRSRRGAEAAPALVHELAGLGTPVRRIEVVGPTLDDVFLDLTGRSLRESNETGTDLTDQPEGAAA